MRDRPKLLAIDQGTTSSRAILFGPDGRALAVSQAELPQHFPRPGWVEHEPERIWKDTLDVCRAALRKGEAEPGQIAGIGITNQRETTVLWERASGRPVHPAIVWQDRRTASTCERLRKEGLESLVRERTGLLLDPYFSATKLAWLLENLDGVRSAAERGDLAFGTIDTWLLWQLTGGQVHATDATNAARTMLFDIHRQAWDDELLAALEIPRAVLPEVRDSSGLFGETDPQWFGQPLPITGIAGDQQAATFGQAGGAWVARSRMRSRGASSWRARRSSGCEIDSESSPVLRIPRHWPPASRTPEASTSFRVSSVWVRPTGMRRHGGRSSA
jgi:glycerol kinase